MAVYSVCAGLPSEITVLNFDTKSIKLRFKAENAIHTKYEVAARTLQKETTHFRSYPETNPSYWIS